MGPIPPGWLLPACRSSSASTSVSSEPSSARRLDCLFAFIHEPCCVAGRRKFFTEMGRTQIHLAEQ
eukprot:scaffold23314_cov59-Phaeocystis_antarctica.AAC.1